MSGRQRHENQPPEQQFLTTREAVVLCGPARSTIRRAVAHGELSAWHTPGKFPRFTRSACLEFADSLGRTDLVEQSERLYQPDIALGGGPPLRSSCQLWWKVFQASR